MASVGGYREGIERTAESLRLRSSKPSTPTGTISSAKDPIGVGQVPVDTKMTEPPTVPSLESPDFVVDLSPLHERAQKLVDSGMFTGEELSFLKEVIANKET